MSGPRVTSGEDSRQDYGTPPNLLAAIERRFGRIEFDLAAHAANHKHDRYFAPIDLVETFDPKKSDQIAVYESLVAAGGQEDEVRRAVAQAAADAAAKGDKVTIRVANHDPNAYALNAFAHNWSELSKMDPGAGPSWLLFLNCEFSDCEPWAEKFLMEARRGASGVLLTPSSLGSRWCLRHILGKADIYEMRERPSFDGKFPFPKDCIVTHFWPGMTGARHLWDWKRDKLIYSWAMVAPAISVPGVVGMSQKELLL
jgi:hypothetical protein